MTALALSGLAPEQLDFLAELDDSFKRKCLMAFLNSRFEKSGNAVALPLI